MVAVKTGAPMVPMGGSPMGGMPMGGAPQPMNMMPPQMPLQPVPPMGQPFPMQQGSAPIPPNANRRKRFGDSLETMLAGNIRPAAPVASDQMGGMNVFTGQMMNTARPPVAQMRNGGIVRNMRRGGGMNFEPGRGNIYDTYSPPKPSKPNKPTVSSASQIIANQIAQAQKDDRPAPVVTAPVVPMDFGDDNNYTPTSAELDQELLDIGAPDKRFDVVPGGVDKIYGGMGNLDAADNYREELADLSAETAFDSQYPGSSTILPPETGGIAAIRSRQPFPDELSLQTPFNNTPSIPSGTSSTLAQNMITFPESPDTSMQPGPAYSPSGMPNTGMTAGPAYSPSDMPNTGMTAGPAYLPLEAPLSAANINLPEDVANALSNLGLGDPNATKVAGGGQGGTGASSGGDEEGDEGLTFLQKLARDFKAIPGNIASDFQMALDAGLLSSLIGGYEAMEAKLLKVKNPDGTLKYTPEEVDSYIKRTQAKQALDKKNAEEASKYKSTTEDGTVGGVGVVDPCPEGMRLDPVAGICVPIEEGEGEDEGPSLSLNRTRDDEFNELDDIMKKIVKPIGESDDVRTMQAGGSVGLNRVADNFLAAMGG